MDVNTGIPQYELKWMAEMHRERPPSPGSTEGSSLFPISRQTSDFKDPTMNGDIFTANGSEKPHTEV